MASKWRPAFRRLLSTKGGGSAAAEQQPLKSAGAQADALTADVLLNPQRLAGYALEPAMAAARSRPWLRALVGAAGITAVAAGTAAALWWPTERVLVPQAMREAILACPNRAVSQLSDGSEDMFGRRTELDALLRLSQRPAASLSVLSAPQGLGKSRLLRKFAETRPAVFLDLRSVASCSHTIFQDALYQVLEPSSWLGRTVYAYYKMFVAGGRQPKREYGISTPSWNHSSLTMVNELLVHLASALRTIAEQPPADGSLDGGAKPVVVLDGVDALLERARGSEDAHLWASLVAMLERFAVQVSSEMGVAHVVLAVRDSDILPAGALHGSMPEVAQAADYYYLEGLETSAELGRIVAQCRAKGFDPDHMEPCIKLANYARSAGVTQRVRATLAEGPGGPPPGVVSALQVHFGKEPPKIEDCVSCWGPMPGEHLVPLSAAMDPHNLALVPSTAVLEKLVRASVLSYRRGQPLAWLHDDEIGLVSEPQIGMDALVLRALEDCGPLPVPVRVRFRQRREPDQKQDMRTLLSVAIRARTLDALREEVVAQTRPWRWARRARRVLHVGPDGRETILSNDLQVRALEAGSELVVEV